MTARAQRARTAVGIAVLAALALFSWQRLQLHQNITHFLPEGMFAREAELARTISSSQLSRAMILLVEAESWETAARVGERFAQSLRADPLFQWVYEGPDEDFENAAFDAFFPRRMLLLSNEPEAEIPEILSEDGLNHAAERLKRALAGALGVQSGWLSADPLLSFTDYLLQLQESQGDALEIVDGRFRVPDRQATVLFASTTPDAFDTAQQRKVIERIDQSFSDATDDVPGNARLSRSGVNLFAVAGEESTRADITRISTLGMLAAVLLFAVLFRSLRTVCLLPLPLGAGFLGGLAACLAIFGSVHGMTLAIGSALIGVTIDYCLHFLVHHSLREEATQAAFATARLTRRAILLGAGTTACGFAGFGWTAIGGMREIAVFAICGIATAVAVTLWVLPGLLGSSAAQSQPLAPVLRRLHAERLSAWAKGSGGLAIGLVVLGALAIPRLHWNDDPAALLRNDPRLVAEDEKARAAVSAMSPGIFVVASGPSTEVALQRNDQAFLLLEDAREAGELAEFQSLHDFLWSQSLQQRNADVLQADPTFYERLDRVFSDHGFRGGAFSALERSLDEIPEPLSTEELALTPLARVLETSIIEADHESLVLTRLAGVHDADAVRQRLASSDGLDWLDQPSFLEAAFGVFRSRSVSLLSIGLVVILGAVLLVYRNLRPAVAAALPAFVAAPAALSILALTQDGLNVMHVMGASLVISIVVDYSVFLIEGLESPKRTAIAVTSSIVACSTTVLTFGLLAASQIPALSALGATVSLGCALGLLLTPMGLLWAGRGAAQQSA